MHFYVSTMPFPSWATACGHNLIGTSGAGAGVVLKEIMEKYGIGGTLKVFGTPAEENGSGKITMLDEGIFEGVGYVPDHASQRSVHGR